MGSGRGDRNQAAADLVRLILKLPASMGSGRGDRNQLELSIPYDSGAGAPQWGPVVVTGIRVVDPADNTGGGDASMGSGRGDRNQLFCYVAMRCAGLLLQWGPVVVTGIRSGTAPGPALRAAKCFNGVRSW